jgi:two-component system response regulator HydG
VLLGRQEVVELDDLPRNFRRGPGLSPVFDAIVPMREMQRRYAAWVLEQNEGVRARAARGLGIDVKTLARLLEPEEAVE